MAARLTNRAQRYSRRDASDGNTLAAMLQMATQARGDASDGKALGDTPDGDAPSLCMTLLQSALVQFLFLSSFTMLGLLTWLVLHFLPPTAAR
ncbi:hypothetical protein AMTR_s00121p00092760 [Amborella trichopoda]|uniref:Uncharacterized protein n=1 Tax=Amborella trichopoda TaxID=13333 RepID=W1NRS6_AMBTC|nr:hypothetical protein AMTR_s00121p00092760 [Amborella trichopoda]